VSDQQDVPSPLRRFGGTDAELAGELRGWWARVRTRAGVEVMGRRRMVAHMEAWHRMQSMEEADRREA
jgi:hypothetical protein